MTHPAAIDRRSLVLDHLVDDTPRHISSLVVHARPEAVGTVLDSMREMPGTEFHVSDSRGKLVVTLETRSELEIVQRLDAIQTLEGVLSVALVFHHIDHS